MKALPFSALRTLEAVVRLNGFSRAAEDLNVTQSAVSQHIKALEQWTGHRLLTRGARKTVPRKNGARLAREIAKGFGEVEAVCDEMRDQNRSTIRGVALAAPPGFGFVWLLPRLMNFDQKFPHIPISLSADLLTHDLLLDEIDVLIHYGSGEFSGLHVEKLMSETMSPVCVPELIHHLHGVQDLDRCTILKDDVQHTGDPPTWEYWAEKADVKLPKLVRVRKFGQANMVVQAAIKGLGVAMGRSPLVCDAVANGTLVHPFPHVVQSQYSYWFVCRPAALKSKSVTAFRTWLYEEVARQPSI